MDPLEQQKLDRFTIEFAVVAIGILMLLVAAGIYYLTN